MVFAGQWDLTPLASYLQLHEVSGEPSYEDSHPLSLLASCLSSNSACQRSLAASLLAA